MADGSRSEMRSSSGTENSRPITAAICATPFASPRRSSRAMSESCRVSGIVLDAPSAFVPDDSSTSRTICASSSTKSGIPSAREMSCDTVSPGSAVRTRRWPSILVTSSRDRRGSASTDNGGRTRHGISNSGRLVRSINVRAVAIRSIKCPRTSMVEGSHQCKSSMSSKTGCWRPRTSTHSTSISIRRARTSSGARVGIADDASTCSPSNCPSTCVASAVGSVVASTRCCSLASLSAAVSVPEKPSP
jgi:hypothetical protein